MKLNNKGFAVSTILYGVLSLIILILMIIFGVMRASKDMNEDLVERLTDSMNACVLHEINLESCYFNNDSNCEKFLEIYENCIEDKEVKKLKNRILLDNNGGQSDANIDFSQPSSDTNGKGLYYTNANTEDNKTTYYFRGNVTNNYVKFGSYTSKYSRYRGYYEYTDSYSMEYEASSGCSSFYQCNEYIYGEEGEDMYWRIVRINEDGSIRLIYAGPSIDATGEQSTIGDSHIYNGSSYNATSVGYMYGSTSATTYLDTHNNTTNSTLKTMIDTWYQKGVINYSSYLADAGFCNDRSVATSSNLWHYDSISIYNDTALGYGTNTTYYGAYNRVVNLKKPQFACPQINDLFTTSTSSKGNKALIYPVGTITADEVQYAGIGYLNNGVTNLTMSPRATGDALENGFYHISGSSIGTNGVWLGNFVRPVINLKSNVEIMSGNGTATNPYVIKTN